MLKQLAHPLTITLGLMALAVLLLVLRRRGPGLACVLLAFAWTYALATPVVADALQASLERRFQPLPAARMPAADAIVVLGGGVHPRSAPRAGPNLLGGADRIWYAAELHAAGRAPVVIATGRRPYLDDGPAAADAAADMLAALGVPREVIVAPGRSATTYTDARIVRDVLAERGLERVLLVTSALHMPRALATFQAAGVAVFPAPTDFEVTDAHARRGFAWLPDADAFHGSARALHEYLGTLYYRMTNRI